MRDIFSAHFSRYPNMRPQDAVKLVYQSVYGAGHLVSDPTEASTRLKAEFASSPSIKIPLTEEIGENRVRLYLSSMECK